MVHEPMGDDGPSSSVALQHPALVHTPYSAFLGGGSVWKFVATALVSARLSTKLQLYRRTEQKRSPERAELSEPWR